MVYWVGASLGLASFLVRLVEFFSPATLLLDAAFPADMTDDFLSVAMVTVNRGAGMQLSG